jgi:hypothetical protein
MLEDGHMLSDDVGDVREDEAKWPEPSACRKLQDTDRGSITSKITR